MKLTLNFSILLNLLLLGALCFVLTKHRKEQTVVATAPSETKLPAQVSASPAPQTQPVAPAGTFRWNQLDSGNDYRLFIANLRAIGCPENTIEDIVRGNVGRAFAWERSRLKADGTEYGPWSPEKERELVGSLMGGPATASAANTQGGIGGLGLSTTTGIANAGQNPGNPVQSSNNGGTAFAQSQNGQPYTPPWFSQNINRPAGASISAPGSSSVSPAQPYANAPNSQNQYANNSVNPNYQPVAPVSSPNDSSGRQTSQTAPSAASDPYALSSQDIMALDQQKYNEWFKSQVQAQAGNGNLAINPFAFSPQ